MVVNILIHVECCEDVKCVAEVYLSRNSDIAAKDREKVYGADNGVDVNDRHNPVTIVVEVRLNYPHAVVGVGLVKGLAELVDERTREGLISDFKREKKVDPSDV